MIWGRKVKTKFVLESTVGRMEGHVDEHLSLSLKLDGTHWFICDAVPNDDGVVAPKVLASMLRQLAKKLEELG